MAKDIKSLVSDLKLLQKKLETVIARELPKIGEDLKEQVVERIQDGYGVSKDGGKKAKFNKLKDSTIKSREYKKKKGKLSDNTSPEISNQTETGRMVEDMVVKTSKKGLELTLKPPKDREEVAEHNVQKGRIAYNISGEELKELNNTIQDLADKVVKDILKNS